MANALSPKTFSETIKAYYYLVKPGIVRGNLLAAVAGYLFAAQRHPKLLEFVGLAGGISLIVAGSCVINNVLDRGLDKHMARTAKRALVTGVISPGAALWYAAVLLGLGSWLLWRYTTPMALVVAYIGVIDYVILYWLAKRASVFGTEVGSISGAIPPVVGYTAVTGRLDLSAALLFALLVVWQMPHFYAISMYRHDEYKAAGIPVFAVKFGFARTKQRILLYMAALCVIAPLLTITNRASISFGLVAFVACLTWLIKAYRSTKTGKEWGKQQFLTSIMVLPLLCAMLMVNAWLP